MRRQQFQALLGATTFFFALTFWATKSNRQSNDYSNIPYAGPSIALNPEAEHGFMPLGIAQEFCQRRRFDVYSTRDRRRKVYDLFLINTELDWAEIRLNELYDEVDYFIVLEAATTFQEGPKPLHFYNNWAYFEPFHSKIIHKVVNFTGVNIPRGDTWERERFTRNALFDQAIAILDGPHAPAQGDVLVVGDVDEIPRLSTVTTLRNCAFPPRVTLRSHFYYYSFQWLHRGDWPHPQATFFNGASETIRPQDLRLGKPHAELYHAAWHCSSCMPTLQHLIIKIESFAHKVYNHPYILDPQKLSQKIRNGEDIFERKNEIFDRVNDNLDIPKFLLKEENRQRFGYILDRDPPNANFQDL
ncbi:hypothetical protein MMC28_008367 [Mycoblastus sanguinarius]|nr:hypothetical protein [Mycoblastus sanguinarius]